MQVSKAARRYASALLQLAQERDEVEKILEDIRLIKNTVDGSRELLLFLRSPVVKQDDKEQALNRIFADKVEEATRLFIQLMVRKGRENLLDQIAESFIQQYNRYAGIVKVEAFTASPLTEEQVRHLQKSLEERTDMKVDLKITEKPDLKGGIAVRIDDTVIDGTVKHKFDQLESLFFESAV